MSGTSRRLMRAMRWWSARPRATRIYRRSRCPSSGPALRPKLHILAIVLVLGTIARAQAVSIQLDAGAFRVAGWQAPATPPVGGWASVFSLYAGTADAPAMLGSYSVEGGTLVFRPRYPLAAGVKYRSVFRQPGQRTPIERSFDGPAQPAAPATRFAHVYPSADVLPSNTLRLYIYFSAAVSRGEVAAPPPIPDGAGEGIEGRLLAREGPWETNNPQ